MSCEPGTELAQLIYDLGVRTPPTCGCIQTEQWMNQLGVEGCRREREEIIARVRENAKDSGALDAVSAMLGFALHPFPVNPFDPIPGLVDEAIRRAEAA